MDLTFQVAMQYCSLQHQTFTFTTKHIHSWALSLLWLSLLIVFEALSSLFPSSILGTYRFGEFIFHCRIFLPFYTVRVFLKARILKWFAIPFSCEPCFDRTLHHDERVTGRRARDLQMEEIACNCQTFFFSLKRQEETK